MGILFVTLELSVHPIPCPLPSHRTLLQVDDEAEDNTLLLSYNGQDVEMSLSDGIDTFQLSLNLGEDGPWKAVAVTVVTSGILLISESETNATDGLTPKQVISTIGAVNIGRDFGGLIQDVIVYSIALQDFTLPTTVPAFLPQCFCPINSSTINNGEECQENDKSSRR